VIAEVSLDVCRDPRQRPVYQVVGPDHFRVAFLAEDDARKMSEQWDLVYVEQLDSKGEIVGRFRFPEPEESDAKSDLC
jgi:hypothetical protein